MSSSSQSSARVLRRRERRAAERLLENSALRDELTDEQAKRLLDWGFDRIAEAVGRTESLSDEEAEAVIEPVVTAVSRVMLAVNRLLAHFSAAAGLVEAESTLAHFVNNLMVVQEPPADLYDRLALLATQSDTDEIFASLMALLSASAEKTVVDDSSAAADSEPAESETGKK